MAFGNVARPHPLAGARVTETEREEFETGSHWRIIARRLC